MSLTPPQQGKIELIVGPMFSGKTTLMLAHVKRAALAAQKCLVVKYQGDTRYDGDAASPLSGGAADRASGEADAADAQCAPAPERAVLTTHEGHKFREQPNVRIVRALTLAGLGNVPEQVVGIDEGQFYPDLAGWCDRAARRGKRVIVAALDGDFKREPFAQVCRLMPLCDSVTKQTGVCMCCFRDSAPFSLRICAGSEVVKIGGAESYKVVCRDCYHRAGAGEGGPASGPDPA